MDPVIQLQKLTKYYGEHRGVIDLDMEVLPGGVFGYLGPNGAGKTTTIRLLLDLIRPTGGAARVFGIDAQAASLEIRRRIGYLPADPSLYANLTGEQLLLYASNLKGAAYPGPTSSAWPTDWSATFPATFALYRTATGRK